MRRKSELAAGILLVLAVIFGRGMNVPYHNAAQSQVYREPEALLELIEEEHTPFLLIDVRTRGEYEQGYIPTAELIPVDVISQQPPDVPRDTLIILYCRTGKRSAQAQRILQEQGFSQVVDFGGIYRWEYDLEKVQ